MHLLKIQTVDKGGRGKKRKEKEEKKKHCVSDL